MMRKYIHRFNILLWVLLLLGSMNTAGILLWLQVSGMRAAFCYVAAACFFLVINISPPSLHLAHRELCGTRLRQLDKGCTLILYTGITVVLSGIWLLWLAKHLRWDGILPVLYYSLAVILCLCGEGIILWNGSMRLAATSVQMGIRYRVLLLLLWWVPIVQLFLYAKLYRLARREYETELEKAELDAVRKESECCHTKYPLLMVHGVFFRDIRFFNYWGRIPKELIRNGATIFYGNQQSAASVEVCGLELANRIKEIVEETGCGKVNVIAHSKGGLDMRYAISKGGVADHVASLTTIDTPHRGCYFADYLLEKAPASLREFLARRYNSALSKLGDSSPDFISAVTDLTAKRCAERNEILKDRSQVYYQSVAASMRWAGSGRFPLNATFYLVKHFDGENDGLVSIESALWGEVYSILRMKGKRGISHADLIDLNREDIPAFDVREFYVNLITDLKKRGF